MVVQKGRTIRTQNEGSPEQQLKALQGRFQAFIDVGLDFIWEMDLNGRYTYCSPQMETLWGLKPEEMVGKSPFDLIPSEARDIARETFVKIMESEVPFRNIQLPSFDSDGNLISIEINGNPFFDDEGRIAGYRGITRDITKYKEVENKLTKELADSQLLGNLSSRLLTVEDTSKFYQEIVDAAVIVTQSSMGTLQVLEGDVLRIAASNGHSQSFLDFFADAELVPSACGAAAKKEQRIIIDDVEASEFFAGTTSLQILRDDHVRAVQSTPVISRNGAILGVLTTQWDVPFTPDEQDLWQIDQLARQTADIIDFMRSQTALHEYSKRLERSNAELKQIGYAASHDLKEPLRMIANYLELLDKRYDGKVLDKTAKEFIDIAVKSSIQMKELIDDMLEYSRIDLAIEKCTLVDMNQVVNKAISNLNVAIEEAQAVIELDNLSTITADEHRMVQLMQNLLSNAIKFRGKERPRIHISCSNGGSYWQFSVQDNGIGIDMQYAEKIFELFRRLNNKEEYPGTGIGLSIAKKIVEQHEGRIWVESEIGKGSTFYFTIPTSWTQPLTGG